MFPNHIIAGALGAASFAVWASIIIVHIYIFAQWIRWRQGKIKSKTSLADVDDELDSGSSYRPPDVPFAAPTAEADTPAYSSTEQPASSSYNPFDAPAPSSGASNPFD